MGHSEHTHSHSHDKDCACDHGHDHGHTHDHSSMPMTARWVVTVLTVGILLIALRSFIVGQMLVRVTSYSANASYSDAVRICKKIILIDKDNIQAWTALGYAYMDLSQIDMAITAFDQVLQINPEDKGAASFELGQAYYAKHYYADAIENFERVRANEPRAAASLEADVLKYRHGTLGFRSVNSMQTLLGDLLECYKQKGNTAQAAVIQKEYDYYKNKHSKILF